MRSLPFGTPATLAVIAALGAAAPACFPDYALNSGDGGTTLGPDGAPVSSSGGPGGPTGSTSSDGGPGGAGNDATLPGNPGDGGSTGSGDGTIPTLPDGAVITGDGGSAPYDPATQVVVPHADTFYFMDITGTVSTLTSLTNDTLFDKYEVTTAQFDAWVNDAMPVPADGTSLDPGGPYDGHMYWQGGNTWSSYAASLTYKDPNCYAAQAMESSEWDTFAPTYPMYLSNKTGPAASYPVNCVNYYQAVAYCWWDGHKRLATEVEYQWEITGLGRGYTYPWGNSPDPTDCTLAVWRGDGGMANNYNGCGWPKPVGSAPKGASFDGVLDMQGSVEEWIWNVPNNEFPSQWPANFAGPEEDAGADQPRTARSGSFYTEAQFMMGRRYDDFGTPSTTSYADLGIRCVKSRL